MQDKQSSTGTPCRADYVVIGAGIAGASVGYWLAPHGRVIVLERESQPGYHATGRSVAVFMESYGTAQVRLLTRASRPFFEQPPAGFSEHPLLSPRGALVVGSHGDEAALADWWQWLGEAGGRRQRLDVEATCALVPVLRREQIIGSVLDADAADMDVHAIHQGFLRGIRRQGGEIRCQARVTALARCPGGWRVTAGSTVIETPVVINASGAWADEIAALAGVTPIGLQPKRRSAFVFAPPAADATITPPESPALAASPAHWPMTIGADGSWYFKPDAGQMIGSPANADPVPPQDVQPETLDIALAIDAIQRMTTMSIRRPSRTWAGLRSFVADGDLVGGFAPDAPGFFWLAAQGGYGIQTAPAMGEACAALARGAPIPAHLTGLGLDAPMLSPARLHTATPRPLATTAA